MRPIVRTPYTGPPRQTYKDYLSDLGNSFGRYCSYCERPDKLDVEHVIPKSKDQSLELVWSNLLLGCPRCNRDFKRSKNDKREGYFWPDTHNTFGAITYLENGKVVPSRSITNEDESLAVQRLIDLVCLDDGKQKNIVLNTLRRTKFKIANREKDKYIKGYTTLEDIELYAIEGFWSIWFSVFKEIPEVRQALLTHRNYPNTLGL